MRRHWRRLVALLLLLWLVVIGVSLGIGYQSAIQARTALTALEGKKTYADLDRQSIDELRRASALLDRSHRWLSHPLMQPVRLIPVGGRQLSSAIALTGAGTVMTDVVADALVELPGVAAADTRGTALERLALIANDADRRLQPLDLGPDESLVEPLRDARSQVSDALAIMRDASSRGGAAAEGLASLYRTEGRYLVFAANNGEMRSGSGMWLSVGLLRTGSSGLSLGDMRTVNELPEQDGVVWPPEYEALWGWLGNRDDYRNLMLSPRFDVSAPLAESIWEGGGGEPVDGVIVIDPLFLKAVMEVTGPVTAAGESYTASSIVDELLVEQYRGIATNGSTAEAQAARRSVLSTVAQRTFASVNNTRTDPIRLAQALESSAAGRHLMIWSSDPATNLRWERAGLAGRLSDDALMLSIINVGGNKLDTFLKSEAQMTTRVVGNLRRHRITIRLTNEAPPGLPSYVAGPYPGSALAAGEYQGLVTLNLPSHLGVAMSGGERLVANGPDGDTHVVSSIVDLGRGDAVDLVVTFDRPLAEGVLTVQASARVRPTQWTVGARRFDDARPYELLLPNG